MIIAAVRLGLSMPYAHSLKEKRSAMRKIRDRAKAEFDVRVSDVGDQDVWQTGVVGFAIVGIDRTFLEGRMNEVVRFVENMGVADVVSDDRELIYFGDEP
jgi:uncharacterized protein YlxP (DUF503 family)